MNLVCFARTREGMMALENEQGQLLDMICYLIGSNHGPGVIQGLQ